MLNKIIRISLLSSQIIVGVLGIVLTFLSTDFMGGAAVFLYFTVQSNIFIILMSLIVLVDSSSDVAQL